MANALEIRNVSKRFRIYHERKDSLKETILRRSRASFEEFWALKDVTLDVPEGQTIGFIGKNGTGKSTLLKLIAKILQPDNGAIAVNGKVSALLELGAGFHPDLTGRENIYLNGAILRLSKKQIDDRIDDIIAFSELEEFIDLPVKNYSSGMYARLGFATAVNVDPDILLIDEVLAVGDQSFQQKCYEKINKFKRDGKTIVFVSHDLDSVARICDRAVFLIDGKVVMDGEPNKTVAAYRAWMADQDRAAFEAQGVATSAERFGTKEAEITSVSLTGADGKQTKTVKSGEDTIVKVDVTFNADAQDPIFGMVVRASDDAYLYDTNTMWRGRKTGKFTKGQKVMVEFSQKMGLTAGAYFLTVAVAYADATHFMDWRTNVLEFHVEDDGKQRGAVNLGSTLTVTDGGKTILEC